MIVSESTSFFTYHFELFVQFVTFLNSFFRIKILLILLFLSKFFLEPLDFFSFFIAITTSESFKIPKSIQFIIILISSCLTVNLLFFSFLFCLFSTCCSFFLPCFLLFKSSCFNSFFNSNISTVELGVVFSFYGLSHNFFIFELNIGNSFSDESFWVSDNSNIQDSILFQIVKMCSQIFFVCDKWQISDENGGLKIIQIPIFFPFNINSDVFTLEKLLI